MEVSRTGGRGVLSLKAATALAAAAGLLALLSPLAGAQETLREALLRNQAGREAALYETVDGEHAFVLDRTGEPPLLQYQDSFEVFALTSVPASRGDELLKTDTGEDLLRVTTLGAVTLYPSEKPTGLPATRLGPADAFPALEDTRPNVVDSFRLLTLSAGDVKVETPVAPASAAATNALFADAARVTAEGLRASAAAGERDVEVATIIFVFGAGADARLEDGTLVVQLDPEQGYAGRPSSLKIAAALRGD